MIVTATELANKTRAILDRVVQGSEVDVQRHGKTVVQMRRKVGVSREELIEALKELRFSADEQRELKAAMSEANKVFGYAGRD